MGFVGIEEIFLQVKDLEKAIDFYHHKLWHGHNATAAGVSPPLGCLS